LFYEIHADADSDTDKDNRVVLVSGLNVSGLMWTPQIKFLRGKGYALLTVDNRGAGRSSHGKAIRFT
jgi:alpha-beta hydrolase superfamily lysophospholipase